MQVSLAWTSLIFTVTSVASLNKITFDVTILVGEQGTCLCWCQRFFNTADFSWLSDAEKKLGFIENWMVPFWLTSSWAILWKKTALFVLNKTSPLQSTENILFSNHMVEGFSCCRCCFNSSKIISSKVRINKIGIWSPGHKILRMESDANVCSTLILLLPFQKRLWCFL